jgi:hypothetical protein
MASHASSLEARGLPAWDLDVAIVIDVLNGGQHVEETRVIR